MLCGWGVKVALGRYSFFADKTVLPYLSALENAFVFKGALQNVQVYFFWQDAFSRYQRITQT